MPTSITPVCERPEQTVLKAAAEANNQLPLVSVSRRDIWLPLLWPVIAIRCVKGRQGGGAGPARSPDKPPKLLAFGTKMSLSLVFAPAEAVEDMAEALPVCLWGRDNASPPRQQRVFKHF